MKVQKLLLAINNEVSVFAKIKMKTLTFTQFFDKFVSNWEQVFYHQNTMNTSNQETTKFQQAQYARIKAKFPTQEELIAATYVRTGMLPMSSFEEGKKVADVEVGYAAFDIKTSVNPPLLLSFKHEEMKELAKLYEQNDKLLVVIENVKKPVIATKPAQAKAGSGCAYSKSAAC